MHLLDPMLSLFIQGVKSFVSFWADDDPCLEPMH